MDSTEQEYARRTRQARREGLLYLVVAISTVVIGFMLKHAGGW